MKSIIVKNIFLSICLLLISCCKENKRLPVVENETIKKLIHVGANQTDKYLELLKGKNVAIVANQTSVIFKRDSTYVHLVDTLLDRNITVSKVFAPEHGFRGKADAGEHVFDGIDKKTGLSIASLYGKNRKPSPEMMQDLDIVIYDIQDVGVRFYTYIGTLHYVMEACAEANIPLLILDRPNPNAHYIDGPVLEMEFKGFVGMHPVPIVHGMTIGEYAKMINGEKWLEGGTQCDITVISIENYTHQTSYSLPIKPSPNLPNDQSIDLYASLCFFEGTDVSIGRGTDKQFQIVGSPNYQVADFEYQFTPKPNNGAKHPKHQDKICYGYDLSSIAPQNKVNLKWLIEFYSAHQQNTPKVQFYNQFFTKLAGTEKLQEQIDQGLSADEIRETWQDGLDSYKTIRNKYLLYE